MKEPESLIKAFELEDHGELSDATTKTSISSQEPPIGDSLPVGEEGNSEFLTCFLMLNAMIGSGILNQPKVFETAGLGFALIMFAVSAGFIWLSLVTLVECGVRQGKYDYSELALNTFGVAGESLVDAAIVVGNFGALVSYLDIIGGTSSNLLFSWGCSSNGGCGPYLTTSLFVAIFILPCCALRYFGHLAIYSVVSITAIVSCLVLVIVAGPIVGSADDVPPGFNKNGGSQLGSIIFTLSCAFAAFPSYKSMHKPTPEKWRRVSMNVVIIGFFLCCAMGIAGSLSFGSSVDGVILDNFTGHYADFFKILLIIHLILYIPVEFVVLRHSLIKLFCNKSGVLVSYPLHLALTIVILFLATMVILLLRSGGLSQGNAFSLVLDFTGAITGSLVSFIIPGAIYIKIYQQTEKSFYPNLIMVIFGICVMIIVPIISVLSAP